MCVSDGAAVYSIYHKEGPAVCRYEKCSLEQEFDLQEVVDRFWQWTSSLLLYGFEEPLAMHETEGQVLQYFICESTFLSFSKKSLHNSNGRESAV
ncbi:hypothetical protein M3650_14360 [Paenibacillus sp. MER TA 81-3]|uniref:hypothetical protein n=1 Tax=Paenibacillus sp. MER TA 81-3 TaxID=2939573 RepID=UPI00203BE025|nr:hypothetical protein [Paenibacillus sp. MER TA 81-3]MCM3339779.1 hypothetical protein [Paenibacillus sp. MER TA 81-3]